MHFCEPGPKGDGCRVRAIVISCNELRRILPRMLESAELFTRRDSERFYRNDDVFVLPFFASFFETVAWA